MVNYVFMLFPLPGQSHAIVVTCVFMPFPLPGQSYAITYVDGSGRHLVPHVETG